MANALSGLLLNIGGVHTDARHAECKDLLSSLRSNPLDPERWNRLIDLLKAIGTPGHLEETYEEILRTYSDPVRVASPLDSVSQAAYLDLAALLQASAVTQYARHLINVRQHGKATAVLKRTLSASYDVDLYTLYLAFTRRAPPTS